MAKKLLLVLLVLVMLLGIVPMAMSADAESQVECIHEYRQIVYEAYHDGTHRKLIICQSQACRAIISSTVESCVDDDWNNECDKCGMVMEAEIAPATIVVDPGTVVWEGTEVALLLAAPTGYTLANVAWSDGTLNEDMITDIPVNTTTYVAEYDLIRDDTIVIENATVSQTITVKEKAKAKSFFFVNIPAAIVGEETTLVMTGEGDSVLEWEVKRGNAVVSTYNKFTPGEEGEYTVKVTAINDPSDAADDVTVIAIVKAEKATYFVVMSDKTVAINAKNAKMTYTVKKGTETVVGTPDSVNFSSSDPAVAAINATTGALTPIKVGWTIITVSMKIEDVIVSTTAKVTVTDMGVIFMKQDGKAFDYNDTVIDLDFEVVGPGSNTDVDWTFEVSTLGVTNSQDKNSPSFTWKDSRESDKREFDTEEEGPSIKDVGLTVKKTGTIAMIRAYADWSGNGDPAEGTFFIAVANDDKDIIVTVKGSEDEFDWDDKGVFSAIKVDSISYSTSQVTAASLANLLTLASGRYIDLDEGENYLNNKDVGVITNSSRVADYDNEEKNTYEMDDLGYLTFEADNEGVYQIEFVQYETIAGYSSDFILGKGTLQIVVDEDFATETPCTHERVVVSFTQDENKAHLVQVNCKGCEKLIFSGVEDCADADNNTICDRCGGKLTCLHGSANITYTKNNDGTHNMVAVCKDCGEEVFSNVLSCADKNVDGCCDICGANMAVDCVHDGVQIKVVVNEDGASHTQSMVCTDCGETVDALSETCSYNSNNNCDVCGRIKLAALAMELGNELKFLVKANKASFEAGKTYYAKAVWPDGERYQLVPMEEWDEEVSATGIPRCVLPIGLAAKEMADEVTIMIVDEDGMPISTTVTRSVCGYAMGQLEKSTDPKFQTLIVDMLNYGAEAQKALEYNTADLANAMLTEEDQILAGTEVECTAKAEQITLSFGGSGLNLEDRIVLRMILRQTADDGSGLHYTDPANLVLEYDYTNYLGEKITGTIDGSEFVLRTAGDPSMGYNAHITDLAIADVFQPVHIKVYEKNDDSQTALVEGVDSVEAVAGRSTNADMKALYASIMKFGNSAKAYLREKNGYEEPVETEFVVLDGDS